MKPAAFFLIVTLLGAAFVPVGRAEDKVAIVDLEQVFRACRQIKPFFEGIEREHDAAVRRFRATEGMSQSFAVTVERFDALLQKLPPDDVAGRRTLENARQMNAAICANIKKAAASDFATRETRYQEKLEGLHSALDEEVARMVRGGLKSGPYDRLLDISPVPKEMAARDCTAEIIATLNAKNRPPLKLSAPIEPGSQSQIKTLGKFDFNIGYQF